MKKSQDSPDLSHSVPTMLDIRGVARMLECSTRTVYRLSDSGHMPAPLKVGKLVRWRLRDIEAWIADGCRPVRQMRGGAR